MSDRLPPLTALRAFDAAARHMSFQMAAAELNVTPAALSFQIKSLEQHLGAPLFIRRNRAVELTEAGKALAPGAAEGFATLITAWGAARRALDTRGLTVTAGPAFTASFLVPRLYDFAEAHPDIDLRISASLHLSDLERDGFDVAIRFGPGWRESGIPLFEEIWTPMASPELAAQITAPSDLMTLPLVHCSEDFVDVRADWPSWFSAVGLSAPSRSGPTFNRPEHALGAATQGQGVVLGRVSLAEQDLKAGRLIMPLAESLKRDTGCRAILRREDCARSAAFVAWLRAQMKTLSDLAQGLVIVG
ncbi:MAG: transcriptional regulator [Rhodobacterales bacterium]|nr:MAG: transcriptional regulator [Rhodobacterales bacterium]